MADTTPKPVIFLAFANDRDETVGYLRNLPVEARRLREVLEPAEQAGLCEVIVRSNSSAADIFKVFQNPKFRNRVAIFHYSGHANGYQLLLESPEGKAAAADAGGLAAFLAQQQGLQLVFLNGCSTQQQTQELHDANVSVVISTSRAIDDKVATDFADLFYQSLAGGANLLTAYNEASAAIKTTKGGDLRALYFGDADKPEDHRNKKGFPWNLYPREGFENADQWSLPNAVKDPLFGLPPLAELDLPESPYRHLAWFRREDAQIFFGRGHQIRKLYGLLTAGTQPIILFYGQSGVGKSSLLDAGLMPRLEQNCEVRYLRRRRGGLLDTLQLAFLPLASDVPIETAWLAKEEQLKKPLIVFLDQVEEFYTQPIEDLPDELDQLLRVVKATFGDPKCRPKGKLVLGFRKEWLAELEAKMVAYELPRAKVSLEPLDRDGIIEVVQGPTRSARLRERYGLKVDDGLAEIIADDMLKDRGSAISTTLQILLSKMWAEASQMNSEPPQFTQKLYDHLEREGILLGDFLDQQLKKFDSVLPAPANSGLLLDILARHTTDLGTANQSSRERLLEEYAHVSNELPKLLQECQDHYLLTEAGSTQKESTKTTRLAHDTLAPLVRERFDKSDKPGQRARRALNARSLEWRDGQSGPPLDETDLGTIESGASGTRVWSPDEARLVNASRQTREQRRRVRQIVRAVLVSAAVLIVVAGGLATWKWSEAAKLTETEKSLNRDLNKAIDEVKAKDRKTRLTTAELLTREAQRDEKDGKHVAALHKYAIAVATLSDQPSVQTDNRIRLGLRLRYGPNLHSITKDERVYPSILNTLDTSDSTELIRQHLGDKGPESAPQMSGTIECVKLTPDKRRLVIADAPYGKVQLWDVSKREVDLEIVPPELFAHCMVAVSPDNRYIVLVGRGGYVYDGISGQLLRQLRGGGEGRSGWMRRAEFNSDGSQLVTSSHAMDGVPTVVWDSESGTKQFSLEGSNAWYSNDGRWIVTSDVKTVGLSSMDGREIRSSTGSVKFWSPRNGELEEVLDGMLEDISEDGQRAITNAGNGILKVWRIKGGQLICTIENNSGGIRNAWFGPRDSEVHIASRDGFERVWNTPDSYPCLSIDLEPGATLIRRGQAVAIPTADGRILIRSLATGAIEQVVDNEVASHDPQSQYTGQKDHNLASFRVSSEGNTMAFLTSSEMLYIRDLTTTRPASIARDEDGVPFTFPNFKPFGFDWRLSPNGAWLVGLEPTKFLRIWNCDTGKQVAKLDSEHSEGEIWFIGAGDSFCFDGKVIDASTGNVLRQLSGKWLATADRVLSDGGARHLLFSDMMHSALVNSTTGATIWENDLDYRTDTWFSRDGHWIASCEVKTVTVIEAKTGKKAFDLFGHEGQVNDVAFADSRDLVVTCAADDHVRLWKLNGELFDMMTANAQDVELVEGDSRLIAETIDGQVKGWSLVPLSLDSQHLHMLVEVLTGSVLDPSKPNGVVEMSQGDWQGRRDELVKLLSIAATDEQVEIDRLAMLIRLAPSKQLVGGLLSLYEKGANFQSTIVDALRMLPAHATEAADELVSRTASRTTFSDLLAVQVFHRAIAKPSNDLQPLLDAYKKRFKDFPLERRRRIMFAMIGLVTDNASSQLLSEIGLADSDPHVRCFAAQSFSAAGLRDTAVVHKILPSLKDTDWRVRRYTAEALGRMAADSTEARSALVQAITERSIDAKSVDLRDQFDPGMAAALIAAMRTSDPDALANLAAAIAPFRETAVPLLRDALVSESSDSKHGAALAIALIGPPAESAAPELIEAMGVAEVEVRVAAGDALISIGPSIIPELTKALKHPNPKVRQNTAVVLTNLAIRQEGPIFVQETRLSATLPALVDACEDSEQEVRENAIEAMYSIDADEAHSLAQGRLNGVQGTTRLYLVDAMYHLGNMEAVPKFISLLKEDESIAIRALAAKAIGRIRDRTSFGIEGEGDLEALPELISAYAEEKESTVRISIMNAIGRLGSADSEDAVKLARRELASNDARIQLASAQALIEMRIDKLDDVLITLKVLAGHEELTLRKLAFQTVLRVDEEDGVLVQSDMDRALLESVYRVFAVDADLSIRISAANACIRREFDIDGLLFILIDGLKDGDAENQLEAAYGAFELGAKASTVKQSLVSAMSSDDPLHRAAIAGALLKIDGEYAEARRIVLEAIPMLVPFLANSKASNPDAGGPTRYMVRSGVQKGDDPVDMNLRRTRHLIIAAIGAIGTDARAAIPALREENSTLGNWDAKALSSDN